MKKKVKLTDVYDNCLGNCKTEFGEDIDSQLYIDSRERYDYLNFQYENIKNDNTNKTPKKKQ